MPAPPAAAAPSDQRTASGRVGDLIVLGVAVLVIVLDQITKALILARFSGAHAFDVQPVLGQIVTFEYVQNTGAAFSSFTSAPALLTVVIVAAIGVIAWLYWSSRSRGNLWLKVTFGLIAGGAVGNLIDRVRHGFVVDFIHFQVPALHFSFAVFNVADSGITVGVIGLALLTFFGPAPAPDAVANNASPASPSASLDPAGASPAASAPARVERSGAPAAKTPSAGGTSGKAAAATANGAPPGNGATKPLAPAAKAPARPSGAKSAARHKRKRH